MQKTNRSTPSLLALILGAATMAQAGTLTLRQDEATHTISVYRENVAEPIVTQNAKPDMRPYLHPMVSPDGKSVLTEYSPGHHPHQTGLYWGFTRVNGRDYFHNPANGYWRKVSDKLIAAKGESVKWSTVYHLLDGAGQPIMTETQEWTMRDSGNRYVLNLVWTGEGLVDITVGRYDYGGLFLRMPWRDGMEGAAINSNGKRNSDGTGQTAAWVDVGMKLEGRSDQAHVAIFDHPKNSGYPLPWRVDAQLGIGPCRAIAGDWTIPKGKSEIIRHQFFVYTGDFKEETIKEAWQKYSDQKTAAAATPADPGKVKTSAKSGTKLACVGDSITGGFGVTKGMTYPDQIAKMLGNNCEVRNFGLGGSYLLGYQSTVEFKNAKDFNPDMVVIMLGTNDVRPLAWKNSKPNFVRNYLSMIKQFSELASKPRVFICYPPTITEPDGSEDNILELIPLMDDVARQANVGIIDIHGAFIGKGELIPDKIHPNDAGQTVIATTIHKALTANAPAGN
jgi:lysophospholipase L1-like esterase